MRTRTRHSTVQFQFPFSVGGFGDVHAAGSYDLIETDEVTEGLNGIVWERVAAHIYLPLSSTKTYSRKKVAIDYGELRAALELDREQATACAD